MPSVCTVTWLTTPGGFELFCNRDERHERADATPPQVLARDGMRFLAPTDPDGGGTWIAVNERGVALCLLNGYQAGDDLLPSAAFTSRGLLVSHLAAAGTVDDVVARLAESPLTSFRSFRLLVMAPGEPPRTATWNRAAGAVSTETPEAPLISCPVRTDEVLATRRDLLEQMIRERGAADSALLDAFHRSHHPDGWIWSVSMQHDVAATRSHSHVRVTPQSVEFTYTPGRPCSTPPQPTVVMARTVDE